MKLPWSNKKKDPFVKFGGKLYEVKPLGLENALALLLLLSPHLALLEQKWPQFQQALGDQSGMRPGLLFAFFRVMREDMQALPGDLTRSVGLLAGVDPVWLAKNATAAELVEAIPTLDSVNDFEGLWQAARSLGLVARYKK